MMYVPSICCVTEPGETGEPSPQLIEAVKSLVVASGLPSVNAPTCDLKVCPSTAEMEAMGATFRGASVITNVETAVTVLPMTPVLVSTIVTLTGKVPSS